MGQYKVLNVDRYNNNKKKKTHDKLKIPQAFQHGRRLAWPLHPPQKHVTEALLLS